jgi:hypothetical protein
MSPSATNPYANANGGGAAASSSGSATTNGTSAANTQSPSRLAQNPFMKANWDAPKRVPNVAGVKNPNARVFNEQK